MTALTMGQATAMALAKIRPSGGRCASNARVHRTGTPVRRDSIEAGTFEDTFFAMPSKGEPDRMLRAARAALDAGRRLKRAARAEARELSASERRFAAMTAGAVRVFEEICTLSRLNGGRVFPSYDRLAEVTALGRATVARALKVLEEAGFLIRQRRFKRIEGQGPGPRYVQTSNVYRPVLPRSVLDLLPRWLRPAPLPNDVIQREEDRRDDTATMNASLTARELGSATVSGALGRMLARLGAAVDRNACESHEGSEPLPSSLIMRKEALTNRQHASR